MESDALAKERPVMTRAKHALEALAALLVVTSGCGKVTQGAGPAEGGDGRVLCGEEPTDLRSDPLNCGACERQCGAFALVGDREYAAGHVSEGRAVHVTLLQLIDAPERVGEVARVVGRSYFGRAERTSGDDRLHPRLRRRAFSPDGVKTARRGAQSARS